jgi:hypothetical protein
MVFSFETFIAESVVELSARGETAARETLTDRQARTLRDTLLHGDRAKAGPRSATAEAASQVGAFAGSVFT